jgi:radical SAM superfamily enzyme YgiQ (UPF0313 family)
MKVLLIRPHPGNERFGLGPFFRVEPLGLEYVAAALRSAGHDPVVVEERFEGRASSWMRRQAAPLVGISCLHALEYDRVLEVAAAVRRVLPEAFVVAGGAAAAACSAPLEADVLDAIVTDDGETILPLLADAVAARRPAREVPGLRLRTPEGWVSTTPPAGRVDLDAVAAPARDLVARYRERYRCLLFRPVWLVETARGCPFRCTFCSVWPLYDRTFRERSIGAVVEDVVAAGPHLFIVDVLFWHHPERSLALAAALRARGVRKRWILVQTRADLAAARPDLLEAWRPLAQDFDIFFGLEAPSDEGLARVRKDATLSDSVRAAAVARAFGYGVTGNFVVDPDWGEEEFERLWAFVAEHRFERAGYTLLTPLPGTALYEAFRARGGGGGPWFRYDMHHALWEPRLGAERFFDLYAETWRRSILNLRGRKRWRDWAAQVSWRDLPSLYRVLGRTQRLMRAADYLEEHSGQRLAPVAEQGEGVEETRHGVEDGGIAARVPVGAVMQQQHGSRAQAPAQAAGQPRLGVGVPSIDEAHLPRHLPQPQTRQR